MRGRRWDYHLQKFSYCSVNFALIVRLCSKIWFSMHCLEVGRLFSYHCVWLKTNWAEGKSRVRAGLVLESIEGVMVSLSSARWDLEWQPDFIAWRSLEGAVI